MAIDPALILADEPTGNLDMPNAEQVFDIFRKLVEDRGQTVVLVIHELNIAAQAHRRLRLVDGHIVRDG